MKNDKVNKELHVNREYINPTYNIIWSHTFFFVNMENKIKRKEIYLQNYKYKVIVRHN